MRNHTIVIETYHRHFERRHIWGTGATFGKNTDPSTPNSAPPQVEMALSLFGPRRLITIVINCEMVSLTQKSRGSCGKVTVSLGSAIEPFKHTVVTVNDTVHLSKDFNMMNRILLAQCDNDGFFA